MFACVGKAALASLDKRELEVKAIGNLQQIKHIKI